MKVIVRPRQSGKTLELIKQSSITSYVIVVPNHSYVGSVERLAIKHGYSIPKPIAFDDLDGMYPKPSGVLIDNLDYIIRGLIGRVPLGAVALRGHANGDDYDEGKDYDERKDYDEYKNLSYSDYCKLKEKAWMYDDLNK